MATPANIRGRVEDWLARASTPAFSGYAMVAAFTAYFAMYAVRKPFAAAGFEGTQVLGIDLKIALVLGQVIGYALSKFLGIKFVSEIPPSRRPLALVALIGAAELALLAFAVLPPGGQVVAMFCNGLPLGAVWGLVFGFLEGRRTTELLGAGLSTSYIVASGAVKSVGRWLLASGVDEAWMPVLTGALFVPPFAIAVWMLARLPHPTADDESERTRRAPMFAAERAAFLRRFGFGILVLTAAHVLLTSYRDFRDNFAAELWQALGYGDAPAMFTYSEIPVALAVVLGLGTIYRIRDNQRAFFGVHVLMIGGALAVAGSTLAFQLGFYSGPAWMITVGIGLYLGYVPFGTVLFDRLIAATGAVGTAVFMIYVTDAFGYLGSIGVLLFKNFAHADLSWLDFFVRFSYVAGLAGAAAFATSAWYFAARGRTRPLPAPSDSEPR
ncbi:MAG: hypothetical protein IPH07_26650 [Deltaproteobacteria bacterium]|nr:hypothetical protein [Deltaproteobacteria bacterium]MBK8240381.1 hypothetical protein [Deltaproteobacteria bacterium]MBK8718342.1 hypothetical protein [Deltaproteobacteria bacterium]MBP7291009.1 hypothetical protein [Nannocystaceae bacterium]